MNEDELQIALDTALEQISVLEAIKPKYDVDGNDIVLNIKPNSIAIQHSFVEDAEGKKSVDGMQMPFDEEFFDDKLVSSALVMDAGLIIEVPNPDGIATLQDAGKATRENIAKLKPVEMFVWIKQGLITGTIHNGDTITNNKQFLLWLHSKQFKIVNPQLYPQGATDYPREKWMTNEIKPLGYAQFRADSISLV